MSSTENHFSEFAARTHAGCVRELNEDHNAVFATAEYTALLVADGVSGEQGGDTASRMAIEITRHELTTQDSSITLEKRLFRAVQRANIAIYDLALVVPELLGMSTTLTAVLLTPASLIAAHVGDCRLYSYREETLRQLTRDHTVSAGRVRLGILSQSRARHHPGRSTLTRSLGRELIVRMDQVRARLAAEDLIMVCSDGIHSVIDDSEIGAACRGHEPAEVCEQLLRAAEARGAPDNMTAAAARVTQVPELTQGSPGVFRALSAAFRRSS